MINVVFKLNFTFDYDTGALVSAGFEVSATVVKTKELDEAYVCREGDKPDYNTGRTTATRYVNTQNVIIK